MPKKDMRKEQLKLWRFEKEMIASTATLATFLAAASAKAKELGDTDTLAMLEKLQNAQITLAQTATEVHDFLGGRAAELGGHLVSGGRPKTKPVEMVLSALGLG